MKDREVQGQTSRKERKKNVNTEMNIYVILLPTG